MSNDTPHIFVSMGGEPPKCLTCGREESDAIHSAPARTAALDAIASAITAGLKPETRAVIILPLPLDGTMGHLAKSFPRGVVRGGGCVMFIDDRPAPAAKPRHKRKVRERLDIRDDREPEPDTDALTSAERYPQTSPPHMPAGHPLSPLKAKEGDTCFACRRPIPCGCPADDDHSPEAQFNRWAATQDEKQPGTHPDVKRPNAPL